jgi:hypothetical protein
MLDAGKPSSLLEVASGSGQHAAYLAARFPLWSWQPSDVEPGHLISIEAYRQETHAPNLRAPLLLDVQAVPWSLPRKYDAIVAINLLHISPWRCTESLLEEGCRHLSAGGALYLYGAFRRQGRHTAPSNLSFDAGLRAQNPEWGVRCLEEVSALAEDHGLVRESVVEMPANNLSVLFRRL